MTNSNHDHYLLCGQLKVYPKLCQVEKHGQTHRLEPKAMQTLLRLGQAMGKPVSKTELLRDVWEDQAVVEQVVAKTIFHLRQVVEENPKDPQRIITVPRLGYALTLPLEVPKPTPQFRKTGRTFWVAIGLALTAVAFAAILPWRQPDITPTLVVLPTANYSPFPPSQSADPFNLSLKSQLVDYTCLQITTDAASEAGSSANDTLLLESALLPGPQGPTLHLLLARQQTGRYLWTHRLVANPFPNTENLAENVVAQIKKELPVKGCPAP